MLRIEHDGKPVAPPTHPIGGFFFMVFGLVFVSLAMLVDVWTGKLSLTEGDGELHPLEEVDPRVVGGTVEDIEF